MTPILHEADVTSIGNYGLGALKDALSCTVSCEENGAYDLTLIYPMTGLHAELLAERRLISAAPSRYESRQLFRIYRMTRPTDGKIQAYAHHISYDLNDCIVKPFTAASLSEAITKLSPSSRRAWIEMLRGMLYRGSVRCRPPRGGRG